MRIIQIGALAILLLTGCTPSGDAPVTLNSQSPLEDSNLHILRQDPLFRFNVKRLKFGQYEEVDSQWQGVLFSIYLNYTGPKPSWWGERPELRAITFVTEKGDRFAGKDWPRGEDYFLDDEEGMYALYHHSPVPNLRKGERVVKTEAVFKVGNKGLVEVEVDTSKETME